MEKSTVYLTTLIIVAITVLGVGGEYFTYKYYSSSPLQAQQSTATSPINTAAQNGSGSSENSITLFNFSNPIAAGNINESSHAVLVIVPPDTDVTKLVPNIEIPQNATISPASNAPQDFTNPVVYTVTAQNGTVQKYTVTVNVASILKSAQKLITSFKLFGLVSEVDGYINNSNFTVYAVVPDGTDLTKLIPIIKVSDGAIISPKSATAEDFTNPVIYTVTDNYGGEQNYTITVVTESNSG